LHSYIAGAIKMCSNRNFFVNISFLISLISISLVRMFIKCIVYFKALNSKGILKIILIPLNKNKEFLRIFGS